MSDLVVMLYGKPIGKLVGSDWRRFDFVTTDETFEHFDAMSTILSESIPLQPAFKRKLAARRRNFFAELLPEGSALEVMAERARLLPTDVVGMLRRYGRDVAGAVEIFDPEADYEPAVPQLRRLSAKQVANIATSPLEYPLGNEPAQGRVSLGGVQQKFTLTRKDGHWHQPLGGYPSTHILKPPSPSHPTITFDEEYGTRIAKRLGLLSYDVHIEDFDGVSCLVIERYDRVGSSGVLTRIHQEDMNQALGASGNQKYQEHGGSMSLARIAELLSRTAPKELPKLLQLVTLAVGIGNLDMHGKNISLLHLPDGTAQLAPAYDTVPMLHFPLDGRLALKVGGVYPIRSLRLKDLIHEGESWGLDDAEATVRETLGQILAALDAETPHPRAYPYLQADISTNIQRLIKP
ncbi:MAG: HipA domain-containing protein [Propionibacteriaceae bacterium]|jgi:serine/threonine-protein kinase HipA|nr:HipA domain-containing protein [Propionibacteriaceae bacterium]